MPLPPSFSIPPRYLLALLVGTAGGALFVQLHSPLPWLIGSLLSCAAFNIRGAGLISVLPSRNLGQWVIGTALGMYFTAETLTRLAGFWWPLLLGLMWSFVLGGLFGWSLRRFASVDAPTAFFAGAIGGASEMAIQGERNGATVETIAAVHTLRVMLVVLSIPFIYQGLDLHGTDAYVAGRAEVVPSGLALLVAATVAAALALRALDWPNAWMIGPLLTTIALTATGLLPSALPQWVINAGQVVIGISLGSRFMPGFFSRAPLLLRVVALTTVGGLVISALFGWGLAALTGLSPATMILATAPGGVAEMSLTAKVLKLGVPIVTSFHVLRFVVLVITIGGVYRLVAAKAGWPIARKADMMRTEETP